MNNQFDELTKTAPRLPGGSPSFHFGTAGERVPHSTAPSSLYKVSL
jgi:hypothetical protein